MPNIVQSLLSFNNFTHSWQSESQTLRSITSSLTDQIFHPIPFLLNCQPWPLTFTSGECTLTGRFVSLAAAAQWRQHTHFCCDSRGSADDDEERGAERRCSDSAQPEVTSGLPSALFVFWLTCLGGTKGFPVSPSPCPWARPNLPVTAGTNDRIWACSVKNIRGWPEKWLYNHSPSASSSEPPNLTFKYM